VTSTDVKHSIAGFYYQVLLGSKELTQLLVQNKSNNSYVALEYGADVRVSDQNDTLIEAKFYKESSFSRHHTAVTHTMYNFLRSYLDGNKTASFRFKSNVPASKSDRAFFENWSEYKLLTEHIQYIRECLVCESTEREPVKSGTFENFKKSVLTREPTLKQPKYKSELIKHLSSNPEKHVEFIIPELQVDDDELRGFIGSLQFDFASSAQSKFETVVELKCNIDLALSKFDATLDESAREKVRLLIIESFFDTTVQSSIRTVTVQECRDLISNYKILDLRYLNQESYQRIIADIEEELSVYESRLRGEHPNEVDRVMPLVINMKEQFFVEMDKFTPVVVMQRYVMQDFPAPLEVIKLLEFTGELLVKVNRSNEEVSLVNQHGLNNVTFGEDDSFSLRTVSYASSIRDVAQNLIGKFIQFTHEKRQIANAVGDEVILFDSKVKVCELGNDYISEVLVNVGRTSENYIYQQMYRSFKYRCINCFSLSHQGLCPLLEDLRGGKAVE
jgi:hypothetical protein